MRNVTSATGAVVLPWLLAAVGCSSGEDKPDAKEAVVMSSAKLFSSDDPTTVAESTTPERKATCPGRRLPDQCGTWAGVELEATRDYWPLGPGAPDERCLCAPVEFQIPDALPVSRGNAGFGHAQLSFRDANQRYYTCLYRGNTRLRPFAAPTGGDAYELVSCSGRLQAGATISADWFSLDVHTGDPFRGPTQV